eukprot:6448970-Amphidinium_carterae.1
MQSTPGGLTGSIRPLPTCLGCGHVHAAVLAWKLTERQWSLCKLLWSRFADVCRPGEPLGPLTCGGLSVLHEELARLVPNVCIVLEVPLVQLSFLLTTCLFRKFPLRWPWTIPSNAQ